MRLVSFLAAGVNGAEGGTATFLLRGTESSAVGIMYDDFEGQTAASSNAVTLDAYGAAEVYVDGYVDVAIADQNGTTLRTVTDGGTATSTEVVSTSFSGQNYSGGATAASRPIALGAVLDKWITSAGADDWEVLVAGSAVSLQVALASFSGMFFNVKDPTYGATGDGVTDDAASIQAAITAAVAAGGGIVFFPPGTYITSAVIDVTDSPVVLMGSGSSASVIEAAHTGATIRVRSTTGVSTVHRDVEIVKLRFESSSGVFPSEQIKVEETADLIVRDCAFSPRASALTSCVAVTFDGLRTNVSIKNCSFLMPATLACAVSTVDDSGTGGKSVKISDCLFSCDASFDDTVVKGPYVIQTNNEYDMTLATGAYTCVDNETDTGTGIYIGSVTGCVFRNSASSTGVVFELDDVSAGTRWSESSNTFQGFPSITVLTTSGNIYNIATTGVDTRDCECVLGSRDGKSITLTTGTPGTVMVLHAVYDSIQCQFTTDATFTVSMGNGLSVPGMATTVTIVNSSGAANDIAFAAGMNTVTESTVANGDSAVFYVVSQAGFTAGAVSSVVVASKTVS